MEIKRVRHATYSLNAHLVFVTKYRYNILEKEHFEYLRGVFEESLKEMDGELLEFNGERNHIHLLISYPPKHSISLIVNNLKGRSSRLLRRDMPNIKDRYWGNGSALWHRSYFAGSVGGATLEVVKRYIEKQDSPK